MQFFKAKIPFYLTSHTKPQNLKQYFKGNETQNKMKTKIDTIKRRQI